VSHGMELWRLCHTIIKNIKMVENWVSHIMPGPSAPVPKSTSSPPMIHKPMQLKVGVPVWTPIPKYGSMVVAGFLDDSLQKGGS
jgi:hypothetical protein